MGTGDTVNDIRMTTISHYIQRAVIIALMSGVLWVSGAGAQAQVLAQNSYTRLIKKGVQQLENGKYEVARDSFEEAIRMNDAAPDGHFGLGMAYVHLREDHRAERALIRAMETGPQEAAPYQMLGELYYRMDDLDRAVAHWEKALQRDPSDPDLRARLERIKRERKTEKDFNRDVTSHFLVKYEGREKIETGRIVLRILEDAYGDIGRELSYYPSHEIQVILYSNKQFQEVTDAPGWSGGIYDGKIRLPIGGVERETPGLRRLLYHEYTHAVVRSITPTVPTWLNEGLAQYFEGRTIEPRQQEALKRIARSGKLPDLKQLEGSFLGLEGNQAVYAYLFSLSAVQHMIDEYGLYRATIILEELAAGADTGKAMSNGLIISYEVFERGWKNSFE